MLAVGKASDGPRARPGDSSGLKFSDAIRLTTVTTLTLILSLYALPYTMHLYSSFYDLGLGYSQRKLFIAARFQEVEREFSLRFTKI